MLKEKVKQEILSLFNEFYKGYKEKNLELLDNFMNLFSDEEDIQMIGIGATEPDAYEWFTGKAEIKEIIQSDWSYWGNVFLDIDNIRISNKGDVAWFSLCGKLEQIESSEGTWQFFLEQMKELLEKKDELSHDKMFEATHYGMRRIRERNLGIGHEWNLVITGTIVKENGWKFHTLHWSMPVD